jgi:hypothetical protein
MTRHISALAALAAGLAGLAACSPRRVAEQPILRNGDRVATPDAAVLRARGDADAERLRLTSQRDSIAAAAASGCAGAVCAALARGEVALGMSETQVLAATRTTPEAWAVRRTGGASVLVARAADNAPADAVGSLGMVQLADGRVTSYSYNESHGVRIVAQPADATTEGRARATAESLIREGDALAAAGDLQAALDHYDRASVLTRDPQLDYRIAQVLDKQLRPIEALIRYQLFLHRLDIEKIDARGRANAALADAIARAQQRIIVLERQSR